MLERFETELARASGRLSGEADIYRRQVTVIEQKINNLARALADGYSPAITAELGQLEQRLADIRRSAAAPRPEALQLRMRDTRRFVESRLSDLRTLLSSEPVTVRAEIAKHVQRITLTLKGRVYIASGTWDLLGVAAWMVPGEESGPNVCRFGLSGWLLRDDAGIAALPSVQIVGPSGL